MAQSIKCTHCGSVLKSSKPVEAGKKVKCPKCAKVFVVAEDEEEPESEEEEAAEDESAEEEDTPKKKGKTASKDEDGDDEDDEKPKKKGKAADEDDEKPKKKPGKDKKKSKNGDAQEDDAPKKKSNTLMLVLGLVGGGVLLLCCCGVPATCIMTGETKDFKWGVEPREKEKPLVKTTAEELAREVAADQNAAKEKYKNRRVEVSGEVSSVMRGHFNLKGTKKDQFDKTGIDPLISVKDLDADKAFRLGKGQKVKAVGLCRIDATVQIYDTVFTPEGPSTLIEVTAANLAKDYETNAAAADAKYKGKEVVVSGTIKEADAKTYLVRLNGTGKTDVGVHVSDLDKVKELKASQPVELRGKLETYYKDQNSVSVSGGWILSGK